MKIIEIEHLVKEYKNGVRALDVFNLTVNKGEIFSLLGINGAEKSSLINILTTYYEPTSGKVTLMGHDLTQSPSYVRSKIACVAQGISIDTHLSLMENFKFQSRLYQINKKKAKEKIDFLIDSFGLKPYLKYKTSSYSGGIKRRLDIAMNLVSSPEILFLDEPTVGMDVESRKAMWHMLLKIRKLLGTTIFLTTHYLEEAEKLSNRIYIMKDGKNKICGSNESLKSYLNQNLIRLVLSTEKDAQVCKISLENMEGVKAVFLENNALLIRVNQLNEDFDLINCWLLEKGIVFDGIEKVTASLEDVFLATTSEGRWINA